MVGRGVIVLGERLVALTLVLLMTFLLAGTITSSTSASFTTASTNPNNTVGSDTLYAPTSLAASIASNGGTVNLSWTATISSWATGTRIYRGTASGGPYSLVQTIAGLGTTTWGDVPGPGTFYYIARAYYTTGGANWESTNSNEVSAKPLDHFSFAVIGAQRHGTAFNVTITAQAQDNSTVTGFTGTVALTVNSGSIAPVTSGAFTAGVRTESVTITGPYTTGQTITATGGTPARAGTSNAFTLNRIRAISIALNDTGGQAGRVRNGDTIVLTFSEAVSTASVGTCSGATNSGTDLSFNDVNPDTATATGASGRLNIGTIALGNNGYMTATDVANNSTCAWSGGNTVLTITIAGISAGNTGTVTSSTATWTPAAAIAGTLGDTIDTSVTPTVTGQLF